MGISEMNARSPNDHKLKEDKAPLVGSTDVADTPPRPLAAGDLKMRLNLVPVLYNRERKIKPKKPTTTNKPPMKKKFWETSKEELSWLVYSSYSNHELLRSVFGVF